MSARERRAPWFGPRRRVEPFPYAEASGTVVVGTEWVRVETILHHANAYRLPWAEKPCAWCGLPFAATDVAVLVLTGFGPGRELGWYPVHGAWSPYGSDRWQPACLRAIARRTARTNLDTALRRAPWEPCLWWLTDPERALYG